MHNFIARLFGSHRRGGPLSPSQIRPANRSSYHAYLCYRHFRHHRPDRHQHLGADRVRRLNRRLEDHPMKRIAKRLLEAYFASVERLPVPPIWMA
ncbi:hypothetical protein [Alteraurantiacibacter buctensis]|uniref:Uncharacterized protein n=1 Tax=Alteraurantiacibacter buctensis TaxID=1503981 RepID=A0A844YWF4_9SPHN|nr:hypothetical protein [Alteraurantiacibacter buctensis]MXO70804.1 hypothetical protein [Alteraurantiacibacter buctensis]